MKKSCISVVTSDHATAWKEGLLYIRKTPNLNHFPGSHTHGSSLNISLDTRFVGFPPHRASLAQTPNGHPTLQF